MPSGAKATGDTPQQYVMSQEEDNTTFAGRQATEDMTAARREATNNVTQPVPATPERSDTTDEQPFPSLEQEKQTRKQDPVTTQILAYQAQHPQAKQADVAEALGIAVRTVQRKLAAWKRPPI